MIVDVPRSPTWPSGWSLRQADDELVVVLAGDLDFTLSLQLTDFLDVAARTDHACLAIDMADVPFLDVRAHGVLTGFVDQQRKLGRHVRLDGLQPGPKRVFQVLAMLDAEPHSGT